ncbi:MAG: PDZ domain-containing protein [Planctomycetes bacterium]|nr:PDZ domain-containing protein [Planctomycetota bacterium]
MEELEKQFVCVRAVQMEGVDLGLFQFDYDLTWCAFFLNANGSIYGRYGTRAGNRERSTTHVSVASLKKAMERALELHRAYPDNWLTRAGKRGPNPEYPVAEKIPTLEKSHCIHCHNVRENLLRAKWQEQKLTPADIWEYPLPENIGLTMDLDDGQRVQSIKPHSPAAQAGLRPGDQLVTLNGQRLISQADIQWVLHQSPVETELAATVRRDGTMTQKTIALNGPWKESDLTWRASSGPGLRYGLGAVPLADAEKRQRDIPADSLALRVSKLYAPRAAKLKDAGLREGDVIVAVDGNTTAISESQFLASLRLDHPPDGSVTFTVLRDGRREDLKIPMW